MRARSSLALVATSGFLLWGSLVEAVTSDSISVGSPNEGTLIHGVPLAESGQGFARNPRSPNLEARYGTTELITEITQAAARVQSAFPASELVINDISLPKGGPISHHGSHQSGRDADVLFYLRNRQGDPMPPKGVPLDGKGHGWDFKDLADPGDDVFVTIDAPRTWALIQALVEHPDSSLQRVFIVEHLRTLLLNEARRAHAPRRLIMRAGHLMCQPHVAHDDHFHFRFFCAPDDIRSGCQDVRPIYPWRQSQLDTVGVKPVLARPSRRRVSGSTVSRKEARKNAGPMHKKVLTFLGLQDAWSVQPHPGRRWCP
ncbi:MAG: penicillin-insensitive murein endopeptidase [Myxococcales bacterium]|nr:penicillin-insensitive murein endopeptidase [Myxococcales bacterium]